MESYDKILFTVRSHIKKEPRISQIRVYLKPYDYLIFSAMFLLFLNEKNKSKPNKELMKYYKSQLRHLEKYEVFSNNSIYFKAIGKFIKLKEGWYNSKLLN